MLRSSFALGLAAAASATNAVIAGEFSSEMVVDLLQNGGDYQLPNGDHCCSTTSPDCQIQLQSQGSLFYQSAERNATTSVAGAGSDPYAIVTLYNINKEIAVNATFGCETYCPTDGDTFEAVSVQGWTDEGPSNIFVPLTGKTVAAENYFSQDQLLNITMDYSNLYVDQTTNGPNNAIPVIQIEVLTPFGEYAATANTTYAAFAPGPQDSKWFTVFGLKGCPQDSPKNCGDNSARLAHRRNTAAAKSATARLAARLQKAKAAEQKALDALKALEEANTA